MTASEELSPLFADGQSDAAADAEIVQQAPQRQVDTTPDKKISHLSDNSHLLKPFVPLSKPRQAAFALQCSLLSSLMVISSLVSLSAVHVFHILQAAIDAATPRAVFMCGFIQVSQ